MSDDTLGINYVTLFILVGFISFNNPKEEYLSFINILHIKYNKDYIHSHTHSLTNTPIQMFKHFLVPPTNMKALDFNISGKGGKVNIFKVPISFLKWRLFIFSLLCQYFQL